MAITGHITGKVVDVKTQSKFLQATPTIDTNAYAQNDQVGDLMEFEIGRFYPKGGAVLSHVVILDKAKQSKSLRLYLFKEQPTIASSDNAALNIADAEMEKCLGTILIESSDYDASNTGSSIATVGVEKTKGMVLYSDVLDAATIYGLLVANEAVTYGATSDLVVGLGILQD